ncbi:ABC transporter substrate-binding protein [Sphingomonas sp. TDK1]|uniref:ABC transporter substrate-binding protein n=1 Tax=Sphingomonas sp. TDK1 TaxID=453247 RepID=UPI0007D9B561|nr:ABC transporter substrate-binding protein [Sphingomonas sp. TDK1]OAN66718.1 hypothetical protein A7X12_11525 [Sphingomonas sp. TDK1]
MRAEASRRGFVSVAGLGALALAAGCSGKGGDGRVLKVANQKGSTKALLTAAGVLQGASYRIEWSEFPAAQNLLEAVSSGAADVGLVGDAPFVFAYRNGSPVKAVSAQRSAGGREALGIAVPAGSSIRSPADLVGKKIASTRGSIGHYLLLEVLERAGIPYDRVQVVFLSPADTKGAFDARSIDVWATWTPYLTLALGGGARLIADAEDYGPLYRFEVANEAAIRDKGDLLRDFLAREARGLDWSAAHPHEWAVALARETGLAPQVAEQVVRKYRHAPVALDGALATHLDAAAARFARAGLLKPSGRPASEVLAPLR